MAVDYIFGRTYSQGADVNQGFQIGTHHNQYDRNGGTDGYAYCASGANMYRYDLSDETTTLIGTFPGGPVFSVVGFDFANDIGYFADGGVGFTVYRYDLTNIAAGATHTYTVNTNQGAQRIVCYSTVSNTLLVVGSTPQNSILLDGDDLTFVAGPIVLTGTGYAYIPSSDDFYVGTPQDTPNCRIDSVDAATGVITQITLNTLTRWGGFSGRTIYYSPEIDRAFVAPALAGTTLEVSVINPSTQLLETSYTIDSKTTDIFYVNSIETMFSANGNRLIILDTNTNTFDVFVLDASTNIRAMLEDLVNLKVHMFDEVFTFIFDLTSIVSTLNIASTIESPSNLASSESGDDIYFPQDNEAQINTVLDYFIIDSTFYQVAQTYSAVTFSWTRQENREGTLGSNLSFSGVGEITGDFQITMAASTTVDVSATSRSVFSENIILNASSTVVVGGDIDLTGFTFAAGTTVNADDLTGPYTVTVANDPGIVAGTGITIAGPVATFLRQISGFPIGSAVGLFLRSAPGIANQSQFTLAAGNNSGNGTLVINEAIPNDTPATGFARIATDAGSQDRVEYTSWTGSTFTLSGTLPNTYSSGNGAYVGYLDTLGTVGTSVSDNLEHVADRNCVLSVRLGSGVNKFIEIRLDVTLTNAAFTQVVSPTSDLINIS